MEDAEIRQAAGERCEGWGLGQKLRVGYRDKGAASPTWGSPSGPPEAGGQTPRPTF